MNTIDTLEEEIATREAERDMALEQIAELQSTLRNALQALEAGDTQSAIDQIEEALNPEVSDE